MKPAYGSPELYDLVCGGIEEDLPFYCALARDAGGPVLDLGCGTGRVSLAMARAGAAVTGLDHAPAMLDLARRKARKAGLRVAWVLGDMRRLRERGRFALVVGPFSALQHILTDTDLRAVLRGVRRCLRPGGLFAFDLACVEAAELRSRRLRHTWTYRDREGRTVRIFARHRYDAARRVATVEYLHLRERKTIGRESQALRFFRPDGELERLLKEEGLLVIGRHGDFQGGPARRSGLRVLLAKRALQL